MSAGDYRSRNLEVALITQAGERRARAVAAAELELDAIADELLRVEGNGARPNIKLAAALSGIPRSTIYRRLAARRPSR